MFSSSRISKMTSVRVQFILYPMNLPTQPRKTARRQVRHCSLFSYLCDFHAPSDTLTSSPPCVEVQVHASITLSVSKNHCAWKRFCRFPSTQNPSRDVEKPLCPGPGAHASGAANTRCSQSRVLLLPKGIGVPTRKLPSLHTAVFLTRVSLYL